MTDGSRRFTDREVALVLKKASEFDDADRSSAATGLSLEELTEIAGEVGIPADAIHRAVAGLDRRSEVLPALAGAPLARKAVHAVPRELDQAAVARLVALIDERTDSAGTVSEALGSVRWTTSDRFKSTRVSITPGAGETSIEVVEKTAPRLRRVFHLLPAAWALMLGGPVLGALDWPVAGTAAAAALAVAAGAGIGRVVWAAVSERSNRRVKRLAAGLAEQAHASLPEPDTS